MAALNNWFSFIVLGLCLYSVVILLTQPSSIRLPRLDHISYLYEVHPITPASVPPASVPHGPVRPPGIGSHPGNTRSGNKRSGNKRSGKWETQSGAWVRPAHLPFKAYLLSAFWDDRWETQEEPCVTLLAVVENLPKGKATELKCFIECADKPRKKSETIPVDFSHFKMNTFPMLIGNSQLNGTKYNRHVIKCNTDKCHKPARVTLLVDKKVTGLNKKNSVPVEYPSKPTTPHEFGVCIPLAFGKVEPLRLVEWFEMMQIIGVTRISVYNDSVNEMASKVFRYYEEQGLVDIRQNRKIVNNERNDIRMRNAMVMSDCLYRNMYNFKKIVVIDFDEAIIPTDEYTLGEMMQHKLKDKGSDIYEFKFDNVYFILEDKFDKKATDRTMPKISLFLQKRRKLPTSGKNMHVKSILNPLGCALVFNHYCAIPIHKYKAKAPTHKSFYAGQDIARNLHYRDNACRRLKAGGVHCKDRVEGTFSDDDTMLRYRNQLVKNMKTVLENQTWFKNKEWL